MHVTIWTATGCSFCEPMKLVTQDVAKNLGLEYGSLNLAEGNRETFRKWGITGVPTISLIENGEELARFTGSRTRSQLEAEIGRYIQRDVLSESSGGESNSSCSVLRDSGKQENPEEGVHQNRNCEG